MKKMYLFIFLLILIAVAFMGCRGFSNQIFTESTTDEATEETQGTTKGTTTGTTSETDEDIVQTTFFDQTAPSGSAGAPSGTAAENEDNGSSGSSGPSGRSGKRTETPSTKASHPSSSTQTPPPAAAKNEYDTLRTGTYYMRGKMIDETGVDAPMEVAVTQNSVYMLSKMEGVDIAMLLADKKMYMIYPEKKAYCEISEALLKMMGQDMKDIMDTDQLKLFDGPSLNEAGGVSEEICNGHKCKVYKFGVGSIDETRVYMDGAKLIRFALYNKGKFTSAYDFEFISSTVPLEKSAPPSDYKGYKGIAGMMSFMNLLEGVLS